MAKASKTANLRQVFRLLDYLDKEEEPVTYIDLIRGVNIESTKMREILNFVTTYPTPETAKVGKVKNGFKRWKYYIKTKLDKRSTMNKIIKRSGIPIEEEMESAIEMPTIISKTT